MSSGAGAVVTGSARRVVARGVLASLLLAVAGVLALASPAAASDGSCDGVWVVVDARAAGGSLTTRCAPGDPASGLAALESAGFAYTFVPRIRGFVCTIDGRPDPCNGAPADAYWSYWHAPAGGSWTYASTGAGTRDPAPGTVEGWRFGDGSTPPGTAPPANAPAPAPEPEAPPQRTNDAPASPTGGTDRDGGAATDDDPASSGGEDGPQDPSTDGNSGRDVTTADTTDATSAGGGTTSAGDGRARDEPDPERPGGVDQPSAGAEPDATEEAGDAGGPTGEPPEVDTGEWADPPPTDTTTSSGTADASQDARTTPGSDTAEGSGRAAAGAENLTLATRRSSPPGSTFPGSTVVALGLLAGIAGLTWRQRVQRSGPRP